MPLNITKILFPKKLKFLFLGLVAVSILLFCFGFHTVHAEGAIDSVAMPVMSYLWGLLTSMLTIALQLYVYSYVLQIAIENPQWISLNSEFVKTGLGITTALADILLIGVFVAIAIGYVFKVDTFNSEKVLPKFFIAALLVHFAPLFVGMIVDISNIMISAVIIGNKTIIADTCISFSTELIKSVFSISVWYSGLAVASAVPYLGAIVIGAAVVALLSGFISFNLPFYIIQIMIGQILSGLIFSYMVFFLTRVFMMQTLIILSPIAVLSSVLPQTKSFFSKWFGWVISWSIAGILTLFLLTLGFSTLKSITATVSDNYANLGAGMQVFISPNMLYWIMLCIYIMTVESVVAGTLPQISNQIEQKIEKSIGQTSKAGKDIGKTIGTNAVGGIKNAAKSVDRAIGG